MWVQIPPRALMARFTKKETAFIKRCEVCRVSTFSKNGWPHVTPVLHVTDGKNIYFATDFDTRKYKNIKHMNRAAVVIDVYARQPQGITVHGEAEILEKGKKFKNAYDMLVKRHSYYKANPFKEGESPIIKVVPVRKASWGI